MKNHIINSSRIQEYARQLQAEERASGTVEKYLRDVGAFAAFAEGQPVDKALVAAWKEQLVSQGYAPRTVNSMLAAVHGFLAFLGFTGCKVKYLKIQRRVFRETGRELDKGDYEKLVAMAESRGRHRLALLMETICTTGIRVSEVQYITVEAARRGEAEIRLKGKIRNIILPKKLCRKLLNYAGKQKTASGEIFLTKSGKGLSRRQIWAEMKSLCRHAGVDAAKVFPHNLRHLFARVFYKSCRDIVRLADVLGHSSIETTRIYLVTTVAEYTRQMERLGLVC
ncbi:tyrosine-type recombinase/integrase [Neglectibacter timonensis]|uniref:Site-specific integrase n=1 Tax=Neglectibacter timonensis TaxID=1776382 RepID=A0ABT1RX90_9FIRM|nr:tyrosine-type recombinase/integrase [Neglectibacter timonensis]MCQ4839297.1 site-specific integrase [Neglectibacter timonensis]MCQ4843021.1 site-specific integrase [Neglectibacter timonensis]